ncbi:putative quinol monooxygenase [Bradyrhizobium sp. BR 1432]|uniref:putative quinol monooxygenase n=1 Tax=Bradyrhizobium sp. BR 1432 TaxID=3447966 RepID=UPI003EE7BFD7
MPDQISIKRKETITVIELALFARLEARLGKEDEVAQFLRSALAMAREENCTPIWFALRLSETTFGIFDAFHDEQGRQGHLSGPIAEALKANASDLFSVPPKIELIEVLGMKNEWSEN